MRRQPAQTIGVHLAAIYRAFPPAPLLRPAVTMKVSPISLTSPQTLLQLADQCVKCGLCLPACPTYHQTRHEADAPRGRIALIQGWLTGELALTERLAAHLDGCLGCRACELACPSLVAYGQLIDAAKARRVAALPRWRRHLQRLLLLGLSEARLTRWLGSFARVYVDTGLARLMELLRLVRVSPLRPWHRLAVALRTTARRVVPRTAPETQLDVFVGCLGESTAGTALLAAIQVCARLGVAINVPVKTECCGALLHHNGYPATAAAQLADCAHRHADRQLVGLASACVAELRTAPTLRNTQELCDLLDQIMWPPTLTLRPLPQRVLVHEPCSHRNMLGGNAAVYRLLARIPALEIAALPGNDHCCGAAGIYFLQHSALAAALLNAKLTAIIALAPTVVVTTNPGCALHLAAGLREAGLTVEVCHPVELIARQMDD